MNRKVVAATVTAGIILLFIRLYAGSTGVAFAEHDRFERGIQRIGHLNAAFDLNVMKARFRLLNDYDSLWRQLDASIAVVEESCVCPSFVDEAAHAAIEQALTALVESLTAKRQLTEQFKSQNSVVRNSLAYFPVAGDQLVRVVGDDDIDRELQRNAVELMHLLLVFSIAEDEDSEPEVRRRLTGIQSWAEAHPGHENIGLVRNLIAHANVIYGRKPVLDLLTRKLMAVPTSERIGDVLDLYEAEFERALRATHWYRLALFVCSVMLLGGISWTLWALRAVNLHLEHRVEQRTIELHAKNASLGHEVQEHLRTTGALRASEERFRTLSTSSPVGIFETDREGGCTYSNPRCQALLELTTEQMASGAWMNRLHPDDAARVTAEWLDAVASHREFTSEHRFVLASGEVRWFHVRSGAITRDGDVTGQVGMVIDISDRKRAEAEKTMMEAQLNQSQKLESVGRLASGVAHEINTPTQFIGDNIRFLRDAFSDLDKLITATKQIAASVDDFQRTAAVKSLGDLQGAVDYDYLRTECPVAIAQSLDGVDRVAKIVYAMKDFAHAGQAEKVVVDINRAIRSAITVCRNEWKYVAELEEQLDEGCPTVRGFAQDLGQVVLNLVVNAAHAVADKSDGKGRIIVRSRVDAEAVILEIEDNGTGIPDAIQPRIFEQFFTTKAVGKGTGQGLALAHRVVTTKHGGQLTFDSEAGKGTTFRIALPRG